MSAEKLSNVVLSQSVTNPVGNGDNTDKGERLNAPSQVNSGNVDLVAGVCNPVGNSMNTDKGVHQPPLPMRPIPS